MNHIYLYVSNKAIHIVISQVVFIYSSFTYYYLFELFGDSSFSVYINIFQSFQYKQLKIIKLTLENSNIQFTKIYLWNFVNNFS